MREHVAACSACGRRLAALERSLELARLIWADADRCGEWDAVTEWERPGRREGGLRVVGATATGPAPAGALRRGVLRWAASGAVAAAVAAAFWTGLGGGEPPAGEPAEWERVRAEILRVSLAEQILSAADYLAEQPGGRERACERYRYLETALPETRAATVAAQRAAELCEGSGSS